MNLKNHYNNLPDRPTSPKQELRDRLIAEFGVTEMTVYRWLRGKVTPERERWDKISEITGIPVEELFAEDQEEVKVEA